jgi:hypothetical protein
MTDFLVSRLMGTNAVKSTTTDPNAIDCHRPVQHLHICAELCIAADFWTFVGLSPYSNESIDTNRLYLRVPISCMVTGE